LNFHFTKTNFILKFSQIPDDKILVEVHREDGKDGFDKGIFKYFRISTKYF